MERPPKELANLCENDRTVLWSKLIESEPLALDATMKERMRGKKEDRDWLRGLDILEQFSLNPLKSLCNK
jgi:hypothetical protein